MLNNVNISFYVEVFPWHQLLDNCFSKTNEILLKEHHRSIINVF